ncbi:MAG: hypothetical protein WA803_11875 [Steroidobacteraceae bacterium]
MRRVPDDGEQVKGIEIGDEFGKLHAKPLKQSSLGQIHLEDRQQPIHRIVLIAHYRHRQRNGVFIAAIRDIPKEKGVLFDLTASEGACQACACEDVKL